MQMITDKCAETLREFLLEHEDEIAGTVSNYANFERLDDVFECLMYRHPGEEQRGDRE